MKTLSAAIFSTVALLGLAISVSSCIATDEIEVDEFIDTPGLQANGVTYGAWVDVGVTAGPCPVLPSTCTVGQETPAHTGPGTAGGCHNYQCKKLGQWVDVGVTAGPCPVLPSTCTVGQQSPGGAPGGGCHSYQCQDLGQWVNLGPTAGPCLVLPATCTVGQQIPAHSGPGTAGGCYNYQCK